MRYMIMIYADEAGWDALTDEERGAQLEEYGKFSAWLREKDWYRAGDQLADTSRATTVRIRDGQTLTTDGPFAETKEQLGGYYVIECDHLDQAIEAASRIPTARTGTVEVRPIIDM
jgi:hypothetical protein